MQFSMIKSRPSPGGTSTFMSSFVEPPGEDVDCAWVGRAVGAWVGGTAVGIVVATTAVRATVGGTTVGAVVATPAVGAAGGGTEVGTVVVITTAGTAVGKTVVGETAVGAAHPLNDMAKMNNIVIESKLQRIIKPPQRILA